MTKEKVSIKKIKEEIEKTARELFLEEILNISEVIEARKRHLHKLDKHGENLMTISIAIEKVKLNALKQTLIEGIEL